MTALYGTHARVLMSFVLRYEPDQGRAQDVVQETLLRVWKHRDRLSGTESDVRSYLFTVARNIVTDQWRADQRRPRSVSLDGLSSEPADTDEMDAAMQTWLVDEALRRLTPEHRAVVHALYFEGRTVRDAAMRLGLPEGTVKSRSYYALRALRGVFEEMGVIR